MRFMEIIRVALSSLRATKARAFLTALGIVIGVAAVITMVALGSGAQQEVESQLDALGTDRLSISPTRSRFRGVASEQNARLVPEDAIALRRDATNLKAVAPILSGRAQLQLAGKNTNTEIIATSAALPDIERFVLAHGRWFTDGENQQRRRVVVIGNEIPAELELGLEAHQYASLIGQQVQLRGITFEIIGVLAPSGRDGRDNPDQLVYIPLNTGQFRMFGADRLRSITVQLADPGKMVSAVLDIESILRREHRLRPDESNDFRIQDNSQFLAARAEANATMTYLLAGIAAVSLLVGGIGIMNIMLVSVTERTREIGVRKALGATRRTVLLQFLFEALVLCLIGGVVGVLLGVGAAKFLAYMNGWEMAVSIESVLLAVGFSAAIGLFFGVWPARRAAKLDPIEALRYE
ncbi:MAG TPA: ABC transporter permease [Gemmatimonadaceae bacterium]|nr:ABC transporter permease [Gemmatimonadaceae bacterium]